MRKIKFRAWDKQWKRMSAPMELFKNGQSFFFFKGFGTRAPTHESLIVMEYIGLKTEGKEIYEGDVVKTNEDWEIFGFQAGETNEVIFASGGFRLKPKNKNATGFWLEEGDCMEVVGNIYENPELLEGK